MREFPDLRHSISYTTRPPRNDRSDLSDYHFIPEPVFRDMIDRGEFLEWAMVHGYLYGTRREDLENLLDAGSDVVLDIDIQGAMLLKGKLSDAVHVFIMPPSMAVLEKRLKERASESDAELQRRLSIAGREMAEFLEYDYIILNDDLGKAVEQMHCIIVAEHCKTHRNKFKI